MHTVLATDQGLQAMETQLQKEFSQENIDFWKGARAYAELPQEERAAAAKRIVEEFIADVAETQINIPATMRKKTLKVRALPPKGLRWRGGSRGVASYGGRAGHASPTRAPVRAALRYTTPR